MPTDSGPNTLVGNWNRLHPSEVDCAELSCHENQRTARVAVAYLALSRAAATDAELAAVLGVSRAESVAQPDSALRGLASSRFERSRAVGGIGGRVG